MSFWQNFAEGWKCPNCQNGKFSQKGGECPSVFLAVCQYHFVAWEEKISLVKLILLGELSLGCNLYQGNCFVILHFSWRKKSRDNNLLGWLNAGECIILEDYVSWKLMSGSIKSEEKYLLLRFWRLMSRVNHEGEIIISGEINPGRIESQVNPCSGGKFWRKNCPEEKIWGKDGAKPALYQTL